MSMSAFLGGFGCAFGLGWLIAQLVCRPKLDFQKGGLGILNMVIQEANNKLQPKGARKTVSEGLQVHSSNSLQFPKGSCEFQKG